MQIHQTENCIIVNQSKMIEHLLQEFRMENCKPVATPMEVGFQIDDGPVIEGIPYRRLICSLMHIAITTRPDISFAVTVLSRVLDKPTEVCWKAGKRILRYLSGTKNHGLIFKKSNSESLVCFSDADWGTDKLTRKSVSGCIAFHGENPIAWFSKKQNCISMSSTESEYYAASIAAQEIVNLKGILNDIANFSSKTPILKIDNTGAISTVKNFENSKRAKHIDIRAHFIKDLFAKKVFDIEYVSSNENVADMFTKPLPKDTFLKHRSKALSQCKF